MIRGDSIKPQRGSQTLARGLAAFIAVTESPTGLTTQDVADQLGIHRSIAYRLLQTFIDSGFLIRSEDGNYRPGPRLAAVSGGYWPTVRQLALPTMQRLADSFGSTIALFTAERDQAVALAMVEPTTTTHHMAFRVGMRTPLDRGSAAHALMSMLPPREGEPEGVAFARKHGFAVSHGEVAAGAHGVAAPIPMPDSAHEAGPDPLLLCIHLITFDADVAAEAGPAIMRAAAEIGTLLGAASTATPGRGVPYRQVSNAR